MTIDDFRAAYPEFNKTSTETVQAALEAADLELTETGEWGSRRDTAHGLLAADFLWNSPAGSTLRLDGGDKEQSNRYADALKDLTLKTITGALVT